MESVAFLKLVADIPLQQVTPAVALLTLTISANFFCINCAIHNQKYTYSNWCDMLISYVLNADSGRYTNSYAVYFHNI